MPRRPDADRDWTPQRSVRIPRDVWDAAKRRAAAEGTTITAVIVAHLRRYGRGH